MKFFDLNFWRKITAKTGRYEGALRHHASKTNAFALEKIEHGF